MTATGHSKIFTFCGALLLIAWAVATLPAHKAQVWLETLNAAALLVLGAGVLLMGGGPKTLSSHAGGRLRLAGLFAASAVALDPSFHALTSGLAWSELDSALRAAVIVPMLVCAGLWVASFFNRRGNSPQASSIANEATVAQRFENFLSSFSARAHLLWLLLLAVPAVVALSGLPLRAALFPLLFFAALTLASKALLQFASSRMGAYALTLAPLVACAFAALTGLQAYARLRDDVQLSKTMLEQHKPDEAKAAYDRAIAESQRLRAVAPRIDLDSSVAAYFEAANNPRAAASHWEKVAIIRKVSAENFPPLQRVACASGDSLLAWRRLVFEGFGAIDTPEIAPGIQRLGQVAQDVRGKLLAALLAWERHAPDAEKKQLLLDAQRISPGEPSSHNLLKRLNAEPPALPDGSLWLPPELLISPRPSPHAMNGSIEEIGEIGTLVFLDEGHWEMSLRAVGTPLHEEWPVVRVELGGQILGPTQVNKPIEHDVPFTFDVKRKDLFTLRLFFQNHEEDLEEGRVARRGLRILGIKFHRAKE